MKRSEVLVTVTAMLGVFMALMDMTIVNVALPTIAGNLGCSIDDVAWVATGYILAAIIVMPLSGWLTAYFGRKTYYAASVALFTIASLLCGTAHSIVQLTLYRVLQGFGGGALQPTAQALIFETFGVQRATSGMAVFGLGVMIAPAVGPILGGYLVDNASWPLIFLINVPVGALVFFMALAFLPDPAFLQRPKIGMDWSGLGLLAVGLASLQYVMERGQQDGWWDSSTIVILTATATTCLIAFVVKTLRDRHPLVNLRVMRIPEFAIGNAVMFAIGFGLFGSELLVPLFFQSVLRMTPEESGIALLPGAIATAVAMIVTSRIKNTIDPRVTVVVGALMTAWANWQLGGLTPQAGDADTLVPRALLGVGIGLMFVPMSALMLSPVPRDELAGATGLSQLVRQLGASLGVAIITTLLVRQTAIAWSGLAGGITRDTGASHAVLLGLLAQAATVAAYDHIFRFCALLFVVVAPFVFFVPHRRAQRVKEGVAPSPATG